MTEFIRRAATYVPKGGVGKTSSTAHMGVAAARDHDLDVVLLDLAGQQNDLATHFGLEEIEDEIDAPISAVFSDQWDLIRDGIDDVVDRMVFATDEGPDLIPADPGLSGADNDLSGRPLEERYRILDEFIENQLAPRYDLVLLDLPGKEDNITINGLFAADTVVAPLRPGAFEIAQLENLETELEELREDWGDGAAPDVGLVIPTMINRSINQHIEFVDEVQSQYPEISSEAVRNSANVGQEQAQGRTLFASADLYETGQAAREAWREATDDLLRRVGR